MKTIFALNDDRADVFLGEEEEQILRQELIDCYAKSESLKQRQLALLQTLKKCDDKRAKSERKMAELKAKRKEELQRTALEQMQAEQRRKGLSCEDCGVIFKDVRAKQKHWRSVHGHKCKICGSFFVSVQELVDHQDELHSNGSKRLTLNNSYPTAIDV